MNKTPVQPLVVSLVCVLLNSVTAQPGAAQNSGGSSTFTALDAEKLMKEAFSLGSGRPMPSLDFGGMPMLSKPCTHPRPGRHDTPRTPQKVTPDYNFPISREQQSVVKPPHMSGLNGPSGPSSNQHQQQRPESSWSSDQLHMPAEPTNTRNQISGSPANLPASRPETPTRGLSDQVRERASSTTNRQRRD